MQKGVQKAIVKWVSNLPGWCVDVQLGGPSGDKTTLKYQRYVTYLLFMRLVTEPRDSYGVGCEGGVKYTEWYKRFDEQGTKDSERLFVSYLKHQFRKFVPYLSHFMIHQLF